MTTENKTIVADATPVADFAIATEAPTGNLPATLDTTGTQVAQDFGTGLNYKNATPQERAEMDLVIASIDLTNDESITSLGSDVREKLAELSDRLLDSLDPTAKLALADAIKNLSEILKSNSIDDIKQRIAKGAIASMVESFVGFFTRNRNEEKAVREMLENFMTDISSSRKSIQEMADKLVIQAGTLKENSNRINVMGAAMVVSAQRMRIVEAAAAEYLARIEDGRVTTISDLQRGVEAGRAQDRELLEKAQSNFINLRTVDSMMVDSISTFDRNIATLSFARQSNIQNQLQTENALKNSVSEWKSQLATFGIIMQEKAAMLVLRVVEEMKKKSITTNAELFDEMVNMTIEGATKGKETMALQIAANKRAGDTLGTVSQRLRAEMAEEDKIKAALRESNVVFNKKRDEYLASGHLGLGNAASSTPATQAALPAPKVN
jgi:uncharacterized protein YaaN involved in tellurite resistance